MHFLFVFFHFLLFSFCSICSILGAALQTCLLDSHLSASFALYHDYPVEHAMTSMSDDPDLARATVVQMAPAKAKRRSRQKPFVAVAQGHASILGAFRRTGATSEAAPQLVRNVLVPVEQAEAAEQVEVPAEQVEDPAEQVEVPAPQPKKARTTPLQEEIAPQSAAPALPQEDVAPKSAAPVPPLEEVQLVAAPQEEVAPQSAAPAPPLLEEVASQSSAPAPPLDESQFWEF